MFFDSGQKERKEEMESLNDRGWAHQGMSAYAGKNRTSVLNGYWQRHISEKNGIWYDMPPYGKRPRVDLHGQGTME